MKIRVTLIIMVIILLSLGYEYGQEQISRQLVNHREGGNFINGEDIQSEKATMLHWLGKEVQVYSNKQTPYVFGILNPPDGFLVYKNKELMVQTQSENYSGYVSGNYLIFNIDSSDYQDQRVNLYIEVLKYNGENTFNPAYFIGDYKHISEIVTWTKSLWLLGIFLLLLAASAYVYVNHKSYMELMLGVSSLIMFFDYRNGLALIVFFTYLRIDKLVKRKYKIWISFCIIGISYFLPFLALKYLLGLLLLLTIVSYMKTRSGQDILALLFLALVFAILRADTEFSLIQLVDRYMMMILTAVYMVAEILLRFRNLLAKEKMVEVDLIRGLSHDLRLPISTIKLNTDLLEKDQFASELKRRKLLHSINSALDDLTQMTSGLTAFVSKDHYIDKKYSSNLQDAIEHTLAYFHHGDKNIDIQSDICEEEIFLPIEEIWLNRLIFNLIDNAYKYTDEYGQINITLKKNRSKICLSIRDNGKGIPKDQLDKVMTPFYRVDKSRNISGVGLGLPVVKSIVESLGGDIKINSEFGKYTEVFVILT